MVTEFKSKEQLKHEVLNKTLEELKDLYSERDFNRMLRIFGHNAESNDRLFVSNNVIWIRRQLRELYKKLDYLHEERCEIKKMLDDDLHTEISEDLEDYYNNIVGYIDTLKSKIPCYGSLLVNVYIPLMDEYFNEAEIIQIINGSYEQCKRIKVWYDKKETGTSSLTDSFIMHHGEYRWRKGRAKDFIDCPRYEMPLFECVSSYIINSIRSNPKAKAETDKKIEEIFGASMMYSTTDSQGNIISIEKVYQDLSIRELIKGYTGKFINHLKNDKNLNIASVYKVKREEDGTYSIIGEDKKAIATIYKKTEL